MYCRINPNLFKKFQSMGKKIEPQFADDWKVIFSKYRLKDSVILQSEKINQKIADIDLVNLFKMLKHYEADLKNGEIIDGEFIIGADRKLYSRADYNKWIEKYGKMIENKIKARGLILGRKYLFKCGAEAYLIAIDRDEKNRPYYIFGSYDGGYIKTFEARNLLNVSEMTDEVVPEKFLNIMLSNYIATADKNRKLKKVIKKIPIYKDDKILNKDYFIEGYDSFIYESIKNWRGSLTYLEFIISNYMDKKYRKNGYLFIFKGYTIKDNSLIFTLEKTNINDRNEDPEIIEDVFKGDIFTFVIDEEKLNELPKDVKFFKKG